MAFDNVGVGHAGPSPVLGLNRGTTMWKTEGGDDEFGEATGLIKSNFKLLNQGEVVDNQYVKVFTAQGT